MNKMTDEDSISDKIYKIMDNLKKVLGTFQISMGQFMYNHTFVIQFTLGLNQSIKSPGRKNCRAMQLDTAYRDDGVVLKIQSGQFGVKSNKLRFFDILLQINSSPDILIVLKPIRKFCTRMAQYFL
jgi:hypothetical protein